MNGHDNEGDGSGEFDDDIQIDGAELEQLLGEIPALINLRRFASIADRIDWFSTIGENLTGDIRTMSRDYLDGLGFPHADLAYADPPLIHVMSSLKWVTRMQQLLRARSQNRKCAGLRLRSK